MSFLWTELLGLGLYKHIHQHHDIHDDLAYTDGLNIIFISAGVLGGSRIVGFVPHWIPVLSCKVWFFVGHNIENIFKTFISTVSNLIQNPDVT